MDKSKLFSLLVFSLTLILIIPGCGGSGGNGGGGGNGTGKILSVKITPEKVFLLPEGTHQFQATVSATGTISTAVTWSVITPNGGTIDQTGFYQAPLVTGEYYIKATSVADPTKSDQAKAIVVGVGEKQYKGEIFIKNTGTGTGPDGTTITVNQYARFKVTIPAVDPESERPLNLVLQVDEVTASIDDFQGNDDGWVTIKGPVSSAKIDWYILLIIKEDTYDLWVGSPVIPCQYTNSDGFTMEGSYQFMGKYITDYELPADPSRLTGSISEEMSAGYPWYPIVTQEVTWDLETSL